MRYGLIILFKFFLFLPAYNFCFSQEVDIPKEIIIDEVIITGNEVTEKEIILREMESREGTALDLVTLKEDVDRLNNLKLFTKVEVIPVPVSYDRMKLIVDVEETFYIIPVPQGGIREGSFKKFWAGAKLNWKNFRGRNEDLNFSFGLGYEPFVNMSYSVPWITKDRYFISGGFGYSRKYNLIFDSTSTIFNLKSAPRYSVDNFNVSGTIGKKFDNANSFSTGFAYSIVKLSEYQAGRTLSPDAIDRYVTWNNTFVRDTRNSNVYPLSGSFIETGYSKYGIANRYIDFNRVRLDARRYILIKLSEDYSVTLANKFVQIISFGGTIPDYLKESYGFSRVIRGWDGYAAEGDNLFGNFTELRIPVIEPFFVEGTKLPLIKKISLLKGMSYKFGLYATMFFDMGAVWNKTDRIYNIRFRNGYGVGLNAILPFNFVGRLDFALRKENDKFRGQFILELGASF